MATRTGTLDELITDAWSAVLIARAACDRSPNAATTAAELGATRELDRLLDLYSETHKQ